MSTLGQRVYYIQSGQYRSSGRLTSKRSQNKVKCTLRPRTLYNLISNTNRNIGDQSRKEVRDLYTMYIIYVLRF